MSQFCNDPCEHVTAAAERRLAHHLLMAWVASLDCDVETWDESPWAHIVFLIGQTFKEHDPHVIEAALNQKVARS